MLELFTAKGSLEYKEDISFTYTYESSMFNNDGAVPVPFTTSFDVPATPRNRRIFGFPERHTRASRDSVSVSGDIIIDGIPFAHGYYEVEEAGKDYKIQFVGSTDIGNRLKMKITRLGIMVLSGGSVPTDKLTRYTERLHSKPIPRDTELEEAYVRLQAWIKSCNTSADEFVFAPIRLKTASYDDTNLAASGNIRAMYINPYDPTLKSWRHTGGLGNMIPAIHLGKLLDRLFENELLENPFNESKYKNLYLQPLYHPTLEDGATGFPYFDLVGTGTTRTAFYQVATFFGDLTPMEVIKEIMKIFCLSLFIDGGRFCLKSNKETILSEECIDLSAYSAAIVSVSREKGKYYKYGYADHQGKTPPEDPDSRSVRNFFRYNRDSQTTITRQILGTTTLLKITPADNHTEGNTYEVIDSGFQIAKEDADGDEEVFNMVSDISPMNTSIHSFWSGNGPPGRWPSNENGTTYNSLYVAEQESFPSGKTFPRIMLYHGEAGEGLPTFSKYPLLSGKRVNINSTILPGINLDWDGDGGLFDTYHKEFAAWVGMDKNVLKLQGDYPASLVSRLKPWIKVYYKGQRFILRKLDMDGYSDYMSLVTLELVECDVLSITAGGR